MYMLICIKQRISLYKTLLLDIFVLNLIFRNELLGNKTVKSKICIVQETFTQLIFELY